MQELLPFAAGALVGIMVQAISSRQLRALALTGLCLVFGFVASYVSGELAVSWGFASLDMLLVWLGAVLAVVGAAAWRRLAAR